jgi:hypothetical protein
MMFPQGNNRENHDFPAGKDFPDGVDGQISVEPLMLTLF